MTNYQIGRALRAIVRDEQTGPKIYEINSVKGQKQRGLAQRILRHYYWCRKNEFRFDFFESLIDPLIEHAKLTAEIKEEMKPDANETVVLILCDDLDRASDLAEFKEFDNWVFVEHVRQLREIKLPDYTNGKYLFHIHHSFSDNIYQDEIGDFYNFLKKKIANLPNQP